MSVTEDITAGEYELVSEIFDQQTSEPGTPFTFKRYLKGQRVTLDEYDARRLYAGGAIVRIGERERQLLAVARAQYDAALAALPAEVREQLLAGEVVTPAVEEVAPAAPKPPRAAGKDQWIAYAISQGAAPAEAQASSKDDLIALYGG